MNPTNQSVRNAAVAVRDLPLQDLFHFQVWTLLSLLWLQRRVAGLGGGAAFNIAASAAIDIAAGAAIDIAAGIICNFK